MAFKNLSFYDGHQYDIINPTKFRIGVVVISFTGMADTNATISYVFFDYLDVPDNELAYNSVAGSAPVKKSEVAATIYTSAINLF